MKFDFDQDVDTVYTFLLDSDVYIERCEALGEKDIKCDVTTSGDKTIMDVERTVSSDLPKALAKLSSGDNKIVSKVVWNDGGAGQKKTGHYDAVIEGSPIPISIRADFSLAPKGSGSVYEIDVKVKAKGAIVGKIAQKFAAKEVEEALPKEHAWNVNKLANG